MDSKGKYRSFSSLKFSSLFMTKHPVFRGYLLMKTGPDSVCAMSVDVKGNLAIETSMMRWDEYCDIYPCYKVRPDDIQRALGENRKQKSYRAYASIAAIAAVVALFVSL